jgi:hypothetical protein
MRLWVPILLLLTASLAAQSPAPAASGAVNPEVEKLKAKAAEAKEHERGKLYSELARELTEQASQQFADGAKEQALATVKDVVEYAEKAADSAKLKNKKTKDTEINIRKAARRLEEIERALPLEDRPPVQAAVERLDIIRRELLEFFLKIG